MEMNSCLVVAYNLHTDQMTLGMDLLNMNHFLNSCLCCNKNLLNMGPGHKDLNLLMVGSLVYKQMQTFTQKQGT